MIARLVTALATVALTGCLDASLETTTADQVFRVTTACTSSAQPCRRAADGRTPIRVSLCLVTERDHAAQVPATVRAAGGEWQITDQATRTLVNVELAGSRCVPDQPETTVDLSFLPGRTPGLARVEVTVGSFVDSVDFWLVAAELGAIELRPAATDLSAARTIAVAATVRARLGGAPSAGTTVQFEVVDAQPVGTAAVFPTTAEVDATGVATTTLQTATGIAAVTVRATARAPAIDGDQPAPATADVVLRDVP